MHSEYTSDELLPIAGSRHLLCSGGELIERL